jgi:hypothetical protein
MTARGPRGSNPETAIQRKISDYLKSCRIGLVRRVNTGQVWVGGSQHPWGPKGRPVRFGEPGHSDLVVELDASHAVPAQFRGRNAYCEVKVPGNRPTALQVAFLARQAARGCPAFWATSVEEVYQALLALGFQDLPEPPKAPRCTNPTTRTRSKAPGGSRGPR